MERVVQFLKEAETYYLATVEGDQPRVRPFGTAHIFEGKLYIQTGKVKDVSKQIHANPKVEICAFKNGEWLRVAGELVEDDRREARQSMLDAYPSLQNMYKELENEYGVPVHRTGDLTDWAKQGVLLMNTILTVEEHKPLSHQNMGWQNFTNEALRWINEKNGPVVFLLWGSKAIQSKKLLTNPKHLILTSPHPSPLSAYRGFFGNNHFKLANEYLVKNNETPIQWI